MNRSTITKAIVIVAVVVVLIVGLSMYKNNSVPSAPTVPGQ